MPQRESSTLKVVDVSIEDRDPDVIVGQRSSSSRVSAMRRLSDARCQAAPNGSAGMVRVAVRLSDLFTISGGISRRSEGAEHAHA